MAVNDYSSLYESAGKQYNVDPALIRAVVGTESDGNPRAISGAGAEGVAQLMPKTARSLGVSDSFDPAQAIPGAAKLLAENLDRYGSPDKAILAYHGGTDEANWGPKTQDYLRKVSAAYSGTGGQSMAQSAPSDDAFSAAFGGSAAKPDSAPANYAFSAAFAGPPPAKADVGTKAPAVTQPNLPGVAGMVQSVFNGTGKDSPLIKPITGLIGDMNDKFHERAKTLGADFTAPLDPSREIYGQDLSGILPPAPMLDRALKIGGDALGVVASPLEGAAKYMLGRPIATMTGNRLTADQVGADVAMVGQMAAGKPGEVAPVLPKTAEVEAPVAANQLAPVAADPWGRTALPPTAQSGTVAATVPEVAAGDANRLLPSPEAPAAQAPQPWGAQAAPAPVEMTPIPDKLPPKPLLPVLTQAGADKQAQRIIDHFAGNGPLTVDTSQIVPGSTPTLAHATGNPGIATLERGFMDANPGPFTERTAANDAARTELLQNTIGTPQDIEAAVTARERQTSALRDAAFAPGNVDRADAAPVVAKINDILASPSGQRDAVQSSLKNILGKLQVKDPETGAVTLQTDPQQLYGIRKAIGDALSPLSAGTVADGRLASNELMQVKGVLDEAIESAAPGFDKYIDAYEAASRPIDGMSYLQGLKLTDPMGKITLSKVDNAIKTINKQQQAGGAKAVKSVSDEQLTNLNAVRDDLRRQANIYLGKSLGSTTFQNLATNAATGALGNPIVAHASTLLGGLHPAIGIPLAAARFGGNRLAGRGEAMVQQALQNRLLNPGNGQKALNSTAAP
jgi:hypothetical protein